MTSDSILLSINEELKRTYRSKEYGKNLCYVSKRGMPFRPFCFSKKQCVFGLEYAMNEDEAKIGRFEDGDLFYFEDYSSIKDMIKDMRVEIDDE